MVTKKKKQSLAEYQKAQEIKKQIELDNYLLEIQEYFDYIAEEDEDENLEREHMWLERYQNENFVLKDIREDCNGVEIKYKGNADIVPAKCQLPLTQDHIDEFAYCAYHPIYTIRNYFKIVSEDRGVIPFDLYDFQRTLVRNVFKSTRNLAMWSRQSGKSITISAIMLLYVMFNKNKTLGIISLKKAGAVEILDRIKTMYLNLPMWIKPAVTKWNAGSVEFANGCKIIASATTGASIRGKSLAFLYIDEICFIPRKMWESFFKATFPVISASKLAKIVITTTPNGKDHFYYMWQDAINKRNGYITQKVIWSDVPGRDEKWRQWALADVGGDENAFAQEYLVKFIGASVEYVSLEKLERLERDQIASPIVTDVNNSLHIFEQPQQGHDYCCTVDVSEGKGLDYQTALVIDVTQMPLRIVATVKTNKMDTIAYAPFLYQLGMKYNEAFMIVENNFNDMAKDLWYNYEYGNMLNFHLGKSEHRQPKNIEIGIRTTPKVRRIGEEYFKHLVENDKIILNDIRIIKELNNLEYNEAKHRFVPRDESINDDMWAAMKCFSYIAKTFYFEAMLKNGKNMAHLFQSAIDEEGEDVLPFIIKPNFVEASPGKKKKKKILDESEKRWQESMSWI